MRDELTNFLIEGDRCFGGVDFIRILGSIFDVNEDIGNAFILRVDDK